MRISDWSSDVCSSDLRVFTQLSLGGALYSRDPKAAEQVFREVLQQIRGTELEGGSRHLSALGGIVATRDQQDKNDAEQLSLIEEQLRMARKVDGEDSGSFEHTLVGASAWIAYLTGQQ